MSESITPVRGMPCTIHSGSDRYPAVVRHVHSATRISVSRVAFRADVEGGHNHVGPQKYTIDLTDYDREEPARIYTLRKNGRWVAQGDSHRAQGLTVGTASAYIDPHF
jgi:hypothetical protein